MHECSSFSLGLGICITMDIVRSLRKSSAGAKHNFRHVQKPHIESIIVRYTFRNGEKKTKSFAQFINNYKTCTAKSSFDILADSKTAMYPFLRTPQMAFEFLHSVFPNLYQGGLSVAPGALTCGSCSAESTTLSRMQLDANRTKR